MAITAIQQQQILKYTAGILGVSAGGYMPILAQYVQDQPDQASATHNLALVLASCPAFKALGFGYSDAATDAQFVQAFLANFLPASITAANVTAAEVWMLGMMSNGATRAQVVVAAVEAVAAVSETDVNWGAARSQLDNRTSVASTYTVENGGVSTDLTFLSSTIAGVTDDDTTVDDANTGATGSNFTLTVGQDNLLGTNNNDTFLASFQDSNLDTLTLGDTIDGGAGSDTLKIYADDDIFGLTGLTVSNVENLQVLNSSDTIFATFNVAGRDFDSITMDIGGLETDGLDINNVLSSTAVTITNVFGANETEQINFKTDTTTTAATQTITVSDVDLTNNDEYFYADAAFTAATSLDVTLNVSNVYDGGNDNNSNLNYEVDLGDVADVAVNLAVNISDVTTDDNFNLNINITQAGGSVNTALVNITDADNVYFDLETDVNNNGTSAEDEITYNLANVTNSNGYAYLASTGFETININVTEDSNINGMWDTDADGNAQVINIDVSADFSVDNNVNFDGNVGSVTMNITGTGDVSLEDVSLGDGGATDTATLDASALVGGLTMNDANGSGTIDSIKGGTGNDDITVAAFTTTVTTGNGDDKVDMNGLDYGDANAETLDGGDGTDTIVISDGALLDAATAANISGFEVLDVTGAAGGDTYDMSVETSLNAVVGSGALGAVTISNAAAATTVSLTSAASVNSIVTSLTYGLKTATGTTDNLSLALASRDTDKLANDVDGQLTVSAVTANAIETISISSTATTTDGTAIKALTAGDYVNTISSLSADAVKTMTLTGDADLTITDVTATTLTKVDASAMTGQLSIALDASADTLAVAVLGGSAADTVTMTNNTAANNIIVGNGGGDIITLAAAGTLETVRFAADTDSVLTLTDTTTPAVTPVVMDTATGYDVITTFTTTEDKIELSSALGLGTGDARTAITGKGTIGAGADLTNADLAAALQTIIGDGVDFFNDGTADRAVAQCLVDELTNDDAIVFIDLDADGNFTNGTDGMIYLVGVAAGIVVTDIQFG